MTLTELLSGMKDVESHRLELEALKSQFVIDNRLAIDDLIAEAEKVGVFYKLDQMDELVIKLAPVAPARAPRTCGNCGVPGHNKRVCPEPQSEY